MSEKQFSMDIRVPLDNEEASGFDLKCALKGIDAFDLSHVKIEIKEGYLIFSQKTNTL